MTPAGPLATAHDFSALMEITARPDLVFVRGRGSWLWDDATAALPRLRAGLGRELPSATVRRSCGRPGRAGRGASSTPSPAFHNEPWPPARAPARRAHCALDRRVPLPTAAPRPTRARSSSRASGAAAPGRRLRDHHHGARLPRPHARHDVRLGQAGLGHAVRAAGRRASPRCRSNDLAAVERAIDARDRGGHAGADPGRGGRDPGRDADYLRACGRSRASAASC